ncbi:response regulator transcription factor [Photobacterium sp. WH77]|uniref:Response regulator transcription factor n=1 Tax=Photobacterium arenosum TaxID=2774143 RepID=A0ABR9BQ64_9GAMM|nr:MULTISPECIES: response regulator transcription factor [Photobacterium]MBD8514705.1 response regulator transcription factor [Photobacterium arenosum]MBV7263809.1 response regulator transcription factor [Photobacterium sp. WH24]MCG2838648.1 response regulator transcription factor [Photobacterium sp. WH77]MCG2846265.1 response regulator transcription factor [Photobacterium sp. WH80]MDO6582681.1 response regulator transcription factor [Photobacterium sp. 2_MG-2023]
MDAQYTIVIADDHPLFRNALFQSVHMAVSKANLLEADSLDTLLQLLDKEPDVDLLLLDLKMPGANGMSGLIQLRAQHPELPVVVVSANEEASVIRQVRHHGAFGFIPKSSDMRELISALNQVLDGEPYFPPGIGEDEDNPELDALAARIATLTPQQYKVLCMLSDGLLNKQIAYELNVSEATIKAHMTAIFRKLGVKNRTQAVILLNELSDE